MYKYKYIYGNLWQRFIAIIWSQDATPLPLKRNKNARFQFPEWLSFIRKKKKEKRCAGQCIPDFLHRFYYFLTTCNHSFFIFCLTFLRKIDLWLISPHEGDDAQVLWNWLLLFSCINNRARPAPLLECVFADGNLDKNWSNKGSHKAAKGDARCHWKQTKDGP